MADAKKCDICGGFYMTEEKKFNISGCKVYRVCLENATRGDIKHYDVCDRCTEDIYDFLEGKCPIRERKE